MQQFNYVMKMRAYGYVAAAKEEWLYPENTLTADDKHWDTLGRGYLFMPDPRSVTYSTTIMWGDGHGRGGAIDEYGRLPGQEGFSPDRLDDEEWMTTQAFNGEFARLFGRRRRGRSFEHLRLDVEEDEPEWHARTLMLEQYKPTRPRRQRFGKKRHQR